MYICFQKPDQNNLGWKLIYIYNIYVVFQYNIMINFYEIYRSFKKDNFHSFVNTPLSIYTLKVID